MQGTERSWEDVRLFLALVRARTLGNAGKVLGLDASTLSRRLSVLEERCGGRLFERTRNGLVPTDAAERLVALAEESEASVRRFFEQVQPVEQAVEGVVRITAPPGVVEYVIVPAAREFLQRHPRIRFEMDASEAIADLSRREADIAVRLSRPAGEGLVIRRVGSSPNAIFASDDVARSFGSRLAHGTAPWVTWDAAHRHLPTARWFAANVMAEPVVRASTLLGQVASVEASLGVAILPTVIGEKRRLVRLGPFPGLATAAAIPSDDIYLACSAALRNAPRIKAVWAFLLGVLSNERPRERAGRHDVDRAEIARR